MGRSARGGVILESSLSPLKSSTGQVSHVCVRVDSLHSHVCVECCHEEAEQRANARHRLGDWISCSMLLQAAVLSQ